MSLGLFDRFSNVVSRGAGRPVTFAAACLLIVGWAAAGPLSGFSETWQLVINTGTTIITFLMVFVVQHTQNRDNEALHAKLDDLIYAVKKADNRLIGAEQLGDEELKHLRKIVAGEVAEEATIIVKPKRHTSRPTASRKANGGHRAAPSASARRPRNQTSKSTSKGD